MPLAPRRQCAISSAILLPPPVPPTANYLGWGCTPPPVPPRRRRSSVFCCSWGDLKIAEEDFSCKLEALVDELDFGDHLKSIEMLIAELEEIDDWDLDLSLD